MIIRNTTMLLNKIKEKFVLSESITIALGILSLWFEYFFTIALISILFQIVFMALKNKDLFSKYYDVKNKKIFKGEAFQYLVVLSGFSLVLMHEEIYTQNRILILFTFYILYFLIMFFITFYKYAYRSNVSS